jgi:hypothetical protein
MHKEYKRPPKGQRTKPDQTGENKKDYIKLRAPNNHYSRIINHVATLICLLVEAACSVSFGEKSHWFMKSSDWNYSMTRFNIDYE